MGSNQRITEKLKNLPDKPGVYLMKDETGKVIYVGKAVSLKNRVRQYFQKTRSRHVKVAAMVNKAADFEYIITDGEIEALVLEANLIKRYRPYYNILLRDDKHYPYVRIDINDPFPRLEVVRRVRNDGAKYFGPYIAAHAVNSVMDALAKTFPLRTCKKDFTRPGRKNERPCINYEMGRCLAPCAGKVSSEAYRRIIQEVIAFLSGKGEKLIRRLTADMEKASREMEYEKAASLRDNIRDLKRIMEKQAASFPDLNDKDIFALDMAEGEAVVMGFFIRKGKLNHAERYFISCPDENENDVMANVLKQHYTANPYIPKSVYLNVEPAEKELIAAWLSRTAGGRVAVKVPQRGDNRRLADMAKKNARETLLKKLSRKRQEKDRTEGTMKELQEVLHIGYPVRRIECFDISNIQGTDAVGSMVVFADGKPDKKEYRRFRIKTVEGPDDFKSMSEVIGRRFRRGLEEIRESGVKESGFAHLPELVIVDGGKGQLNAAVEALTALGMEDMPVIGLAKRFEEVFLPGQRRPLRLDRRSNALKLMQRIRDEAHRFAIAYHRNLRGSHVKKSVLDDIRGIGPARKKALVRRFGSVDGVKNATLDALIKTERMDTAAARAVYGYFHDENGGTGV